MHLTLQRPFVPLSLQLLIGSSRFSVLLFGVTRAWQFMEKIYIFDIANRANSEHY